LTAHGAIDLARCEELALAGARGETEACNELVEHLWPFWLDAVASNRSMGSLAHSEDHVHNAVLALVAKIGRAGGSLRLYPPWRDQNRDKDFGDWMRIVVANVVRSYVRSQLGSRGGTDELSIKRLINEFSVSPALAELGERPPITALQTARQLAEFARRHLPPEQLSAISLWLEGNSFDEIEAQLGTEAGQAGKRVRAAIATLRRHFGVNAEK
jgi:DNA-directed RNA polymerase specialized sigma24 family protein